MYTNTCFIVVGATAVGKTSLAIQLAQHFHTAIISADSRQCFREMSIGVAKPSATELRLVKHYFINSHSIHDEVNAAIFEQYALQAAAEIFTHRPVAVMVGGTGLYVKAFCEGLDNIPPVNATVRQTIVEQYGQHGLEWLQQQVQQHDPDYYAGGEIYNPHRLMRALEVKLGTGQSIRSFQQGRQVQRPFNIIKIGLELPREALYHNINTRVDAMLQQGLVEEVKGLLPQRQLNALQTVGYSEMFSYLDGSISWQQAADLVKQHTRHYAKRQLTWFKKDAAIQWFSPAGIDDILSLYAAK